MWIIVSCDKATGDTLYWNNANGWGDRLDADRFTLSDTLLLDLPMGGFWHYVAEGGR